MKLSRKKILGIVGLGYVGLPLAYEFSKHFEVIGFDINETRVSELKRNFDENKEFSNIKLKNSKINYSFNPNDLKKCNIFIITVPTPILKNKKPDLNPLKNSSILVSKYLKKGSIVIYESTVFPGCTEEICVPLLIKHSGLKYNIDFFCGYSPERINFGDKKHTLTSVKKITSGSTLKIAYLIDKLYSKLFSFQILPNENIAYLAISNSLFKEYL